jgi:hypothetical protein
MKKATIEFSGDTLLIDGVRVTFDLIPQFLYEIAHPDPRKWYRFERMNDELMVHVCYHDPSVFEQRPLPEVSNGNYVRERGRGSADAGGARQETANPLDADRAN